MTVPKVSVVICTKNRLSSLQNAVRSVLDNTLRDIELLIIDQSEDDQTRLWVQSISNKDNRIHYFFNPERGVSRSRNLGVSYSKASIVLMMDDDCQAEPGWITSAVEFFESHPDSLIVFGSVIPASHDGSQGRVAGGFKKDQAFHGRLSKIREDGTSGNCGFRRELFQKIGPFDPFLGLGAELLSSVDWDISYRTLSAGYTICHSSSMRVVHHGFKPWTEAVSTLRNYEIGTSALFMKYWRCGDWLAPVVWAATFLIKWTLVAKRVLYGPKFFKMPRLLFIIYVWGMYIYWNMLGAVKSFRYDIDPLERIYRVKQHKTV